MIDNRIRAVLFDLDGTLLKTEEMIMQSYEYTINKNKLKMKSRKVILSQFGQPLEKIYKSFFPTENIDHLCKTHLLFQKNNLDLIELYPNTIKILELLKASNIKIAIVTTRPKTNLRKIIRTSGIHRYIDFFLSRQDVSKPKPDPEIVYKALGKLRINPSNVLLVGDTQIDIETGINANVKTVAVTYGPRGYDVLKAKPNFVIKSLPELRELI